VPSIVSFYLEGRRLERTVYLLQSLTTGLNDRVGNFDARHTTRVGSTGVSVCDILDISIENM
jgi:hypothetical protein